jgi:hypothetical protein
MGHDSRQREGKPPQQVDAIGPPVRYNLPDSSATHPYVASFLLRNW